jgi:hypothetical protein
MTLKELMYYLMEHADTLPEDTEILFGSGHGPQTHLIEPTRTFSSSTGATGGVRDTPRFVLWCKDVTREIGPVFR